MRVLVVEDESELRGAIARRLRAAGHAVDEAGDLADADEQVFVNDYGAVILDRMLGAADGVERLREWRRRGDSTPVLLLTARDRVEDRVEGLEAGADDYLVKPFAMTELLARVTAISRRHATTPGASVIMREGDLEIDGGRREVRRDGVLIPLRPKEYALLELLARRVGQVVSRGDILEACWDRAHEASSNVEEVMIASLRRKLGRPSLIHTVRGTGYLFEARDDER